MNPDLWSSVSSQIASSATTGVGGISLIGKWIIAAGIIGVVAVTTFVLINKDSRKNPITEMPTESDLKENVTSNKIEVEAKDEKTEHEIKAKEVLEINTNSSYIESVNKTTRLVENTTKEEIEFNKSEEINKSTEEELLIPEIVEPEIVGPDLVEEVENPVNTEKLEPIKLDLPNIFTPNGDGQNDYLSIKERGLNDFSLIVLDQQNRIIFKTNDPEFNWDGYDLNSVPVPNGRYVYYITAVDENGNPVNSYQILEIRR